MKIEKVIKLKVTRFALTVIGITAVASAPDSAASDFQSAMPNALRNSMQQPSVNTPNQNAQSMMQSTVGTDASHGPENAPVPLRGVGGNQSPINLSPNTEQSLSAPPVSTFFKVSDFGSSRPSSAKEGKSSLPVPETNKSLTSTDACQSKNGSELKPLSPGKLIWHVLDNIGVPMIMGKDNGLAPGLEMPSGMPDKSYFLSNRNQITGSSPAQKVKAGSPAPNRRIAPPETPDAPLSMDRVQSPPATGNQPNKSPVEKIPQIELEGVSPTDPADTDAQKIKP